MPASRGRQSRRHHRLRHPGRHHAGAGHHDRQRGAALYPGQRVGERRPDQLGADLLHRRRRHHDAAVGLSRQPLRPQAHPAGLDHRLRRSPRCCAASRSRCCRSSRFRLLQGFFGAALVPLSQSILLDIYTPEERGSAMALFGVSVMVGPVLGPVIGGWLTDNLSWRWVFYINVPIGALAFAGVSLFVSETKLDLNGQARLARLRHAQRRHRARCRCSSTAASSSTGSRSCEIIVEAVVCASAFYIFLVHTFTADNTVRRTRGCSSTGISRSACSSSSSSASPIWPRWR